MPNPVDLFGDASERTEGLFHALIDATPDPMVIVSDDGTIMLVNEQLERVFGYSREEILGQKIEFLLPHRYRVGHVAHRMAFMLSPTVRPMGASLDLFGLRKDETELPVEIALSPLEIDGRTIVLAAIRDATERRQTERAIRRLNESLEQRVNERTAELAESMRELEQRNRDNEMFVYSVSHDLRSPLVNLQGYSRELSLACDQIRGAIEASKLDEEEKQSISGLLAGDIGDSVRFIQSGVARLGGIIDALLRLSRAGRVIYQWTPVDLNESLQRVVESLAASTKQRGATVTVKELPPVMGDPTAVDLVFANLIDNALKYLDPARAGAIEVGCVEEDAQAPKQRGARQCTLYVRDNGLGIDTDHAVKVFQPFQRLHPSAAPGEGIGLAVVQRIVTRHGGNIRFESRVGEGTTFFVTLCATPAPTESLTSADLKRDPVGVS